MLRIKELISNHATGKKALLFFILANLVYIAMLSITIPATMTFSDDLKILDMLPMGYDAAYVKTLFNALGEEGRNYYLLRQIPMDMVYPILFAVSYCLIIVYFLRKLHKLDSWMFYLCLIPLIAGLADYVENFGIITLLISYPDLSPKIISATSIFSVIKSTSTTIFFIALIIILIALGYSTLVKKKTNVGHG